MDWSTDGQTPEFLAATRMASLGDSVIGTILPHLDLKPGMRVLDVGSGSGEYCFRLGSATHGVQFTGLEYDRAFVEFANKRARGDIGYPFEQPNPDNTYRFVCGNGLDMPFQDESFDAVISHTYLTAVPDWACALSEMCRVCKPGGIVSSVTSMTDDFYGTGTINLFTGLFDEQSAHLIRLISKAKDAALPCMDLKPGIAPRKAPVAFDWIGLEDVRCVPLAHYFCLSDALTGQADARRFVELLYADECKQVERLKTHPLANSMVGDSQWQAYENLMQRRRDKLSSSSANREWNWYGNSSLLVCGTVPSSSLNPRWKKLRDESREAQTALQSCIKAEFTNYPNMKQLGPGRCVKASFPMADGQTLAVCGFDPPRAILEGCGIIDGSNEKRCSQVEAHLIDKIKDVALLPDVSDAALFHIPDMWESVSEASLSGIRVHFKEAGIDDTHVAIACMATAGERTACSLAAHPNGNEAAMRAFSRAIGALSE